MGRVPRIALTRRAVGVWAASLLLVSVASAVDIDLSHLPDGTPTPHGMILNDQYRDMGIVFGARRSYEPVLQNSLTVDPIAFQNGELFYSPDISGAVGILEFVEPGTSTPAMITAFSARTNQDFNPSEHIELYAFDAGGSVVASEIFEGTLGAHAMIGIDPGVGFSFVEVRTFGNPGIAIHDLSFAPEPAAISLFALAGLPFLLRRKRN